MRFRSPRWTNRLARTSLLVALMAAPAPGVEHEWAESTHDSATILRHLNDLGEKLIEDLKLVNNARKLLERRHPEEEHVQEKFGVLSAAIDELLKDTPLFDTQQQGEGEVLEDKQRLHLLKGVCEKFHAVYKAGNSLRKFDRKAGSHLRGSVMATAKDLQAYADWADELDGIVGNEKVDVLQPDKRPPADQNTEEADEIAADRQEVSAATVNPRNESEEAPETELPPGIHEENINEDESTEAAGDELLEVEPESVDQPDANHDTPPAKE